ncbi:DUF5947 family protein [Actinophytocola sp.]|uniref:DUF5947 family protein n=1 Tax=Actinophytocola sp. TaxID=1872138 RepID=UPI002D80D56A|nr:DUF5947 family protein [Actinophytocola sp.]HET9143521.1 DUF5947 family protein [Actinophytocola sp.]
MSNGLRRFVGAAPVKPAEPVPELCEMCGKEAGERHGHVADLEHRSIMCACRPCYLLFTRPSAAGGRFRAVPERYLHDPDRPLSAAEWENLGIPVGAVFFLRGDEASGTVAFYPSPAGATECLLDLDTWAGLAAAHPLLDMAEPEVEAVLIRAGDGEVSCYLVPIDACYQLVGLVRKYWKGFDGGSEAREHIDEFFAGIQAQARPLAAEA